MSPSSLHRGEAHDAVWRKVVTSSHSFFPVYDGGRDKIAGILWVKALYANLAAGVTPKIFDLMTKPLVVPATQRHSTARNLTEAIIGDFSSPEERLRPQAKRRQDGSWLIDAMIEIEKLEKILPGLTFGDEEGKDYQTLTGFVVIHLDRLPKEGEAFETQGYVFGSPDMDQHRMDKVLVMPASDGRRGEK